MCLVVKKEGVSENLSSPLIMEVEGLGRVVLAPGPAHSWSLVLHVCSVWISVNSMYLFLI